MEVVYWISKIQIYEIMLKSPPGCGWGSQTQRRCPSPEPKEIYPCWNFSSVMQVGDKVKHRMEFCAAPERQHKTVSPRCSLKLIPVEAHFFRRHNKTLETCDRKDRNRVNWLSDDVNWNECNLQSYVYWINIYFLHLSGFTKYFFRLVTFMD